MEKKLSATMLSEYIQYLNSQKPAFKECNTYEGLAHRVLDESQELVEAVDKYSDDPFKVGSELADVLYLTLFLCAELGFNVEDLVLWKSHRNEQKYAPDKLQGDCSSIPKLKQEWIGDEAWENSNCPD